MKILEAQSAVLTNFEVHQHLHEQRRQTRQTGPGRRRGPPNLETTVTELLKYFEEAPTPLRPPAKYDYAMISRLVEAIREANFKSELAKGEMIMILNLKPSSVGALNCIVDDLEGRFPEAEQQKLLDIIEKVLGGGSQTNAGAGAN